MRLESRRFREKERDRKAQFGTYLKPLIVIIFGLMLVFVIRMTLQTQLSLEQEEANVKLLESARSNFQELATCLNVNETYSSSRYLMNISKVEEYNKTYKRREPPCAEDFTYGYTAEIEGICIDGIDISEARQRCNTWTEFGQETSSEGKALRNSVTLTFPAVMRYSENTKGPVRVSITVRDGDLERISSAINEVVDAGQNEATLEFANSQGVCAGSECRGGEPVRPDAVCLEAAEELKCAIVMADEIEPFRLGPGTHLVKIEYSDGEVSISE